MEKVSWKDKVSNEEVLVRIGEKRMLIDTITERKKRWIGHVLRGGGIVERGHRGKIGREET